MRRSIRVARVLRALTLPALVLPAALLPTSPSRALAATARIAAQGQFSVLYGNVAFSEPVLDGRQVVYGVAAPAVHPPNCVSCGDQPFTGFRLQVYVRDYARRATSIQVSAPRLLFRGARGAQLALFSLAGGWLVYESDAPGDHWRLLARNIASGRTVPLDSPQREGDPSRFLHAASDGHTVVWASWTHLAGHETSVIRSYNLATGERRLLVSGGTGKDFFYSYPAISGNRLVLVRESQTDQSSQILLKNLTTGHMRALTPISGSNMEPVIGGNVVAWVHGLISNGHTHGVVVQNLATGRRLALKHSPAQLPQVAAGRFVVFAAGGYPGQGNARIELYDTQTHQRRFLAGPAPDTNGFTPSLELRTGGNVVLFGMAKPCALPNGRCPFRFTLAALQL